MKYKWWNGFRLDVVEWASGFRAVVIEPFNGSMEICKTVYATKEDALRRCWGMVLQACELKALQAAERMDNRK